MESHGILKASESTNPASAINSHTAILGIFCSIFRDLLRMLNFKLSLYTDQVLNEQFKILDTCS